MGNPNIQNRFRAKPQYQRPLDEMNSNFRFNHAIVTNDMQNNRQRIFDMAKFDLDNARFQGQSGMREDVRNFTQSFFRRAR